MADTFDPYYRWLAIPPGEQPPHHYRLLSVQLFETEPDVISTAADRQMMHVRSFQNGKQAQFSQRILNEISAARIVLLDPEKKVAYDRQLQAALANRGTAPAPTRESPVAASPPSPVASQPIAPVVRPAPRPVRKTNLLLPLIAGGVVGVAVLLGIGWLVMQGRTSSPADPLAAKGMPETPVTTLDSNTPKPGDVPAKPATETSPGNRPPETPPVDPPPRPVPASSDPAPSPPDESPGKQPEPVASPVAPSDPPAAPQEPPVVKPAPAKPEPPARLPVPAIGLRDQKRAEIVEIFSPGKAGTVEAKAALAGQLLETARETTNDPAALFVLLNLAREQAVLAGNIDLSFAAIDMLAANFAFDTDTVRVLSLEESAKASIPSDQKRPIVERGQEMVDRFVDENQFAKADALAERLLAMARPLRDTPLLKAVAEQRKAVAEAGAAFAKVQGSWQTLEQSPDDPAANLAVGRYLAFDRQDWKTALTHLAAGSDPRLAAAAQSELARPDSTEESEQLAAAWWDAAEAEPDPQVRDLLRARSGVWYQRIVGELEGLAKATARQRLSETADLPVVLSETSDTAGGPTIDVRSYSALRRVTPAVMHIMNSSNEAAVCINGKPVAAAGFKASQFPCRVQLGDVITAKLTPVAHSPSFSMVLQLASGHVIAPTNHQTWFQYSPAQPARWWELPDNPPRTPVKRANLHARPPQAVGTGCDTIWGDYVYHVIEESDLYKPAKPIAQRKKEPGAVAGVLHATTRQNLASIYINDWFVSYTEGMDADRLTETPVLLAPGDVILVKAAVGAHGPSFAAMFRSADGKHAIVTKQESWKQFHPTDKNHWWRQPELTEELPLLRTDAATGPLPPGSEEFGCQAIWADYLYYLVQPEDLK
ncbi:hypothetical protein [Lignipirellula cremea]|nr:hypothetical protein [Lignipirellula cremea]